MNKKLNFKKWKQTFKNVSKINSEFWTGNQFSNMKPYMHLPRFCWPWFQPNKAAAAVDGGAAKPLGGTGDDVSGDGGLPGAIWCGDSLRKWRDGGGCWRSHCPFAVAAKETTSLMGFFERDQLCGEMVEGASEEEVGIIRWWRRRKASSESENGNG